MFEHLLTKDPGEFLKACTTCSGAGYVKNPYWSEWSDLVDKLQEAGMDFHSALDQADNMMNDKYGDDWKAWPEESVCESCTGQGKVLSRELEPLYKLIRLIGYYKFEE